MKTLYFDCSSGISGDMTLASLLNLGAIPFHYLQKELQKLGLANEYHLQLQKKQSQAITGFHFQVHTKEHHVHHSHSSKTHANSHDAHAHTRSFSKIRLLIKKSRLSAFVKNRAVQLFERIAIAEGKIHGIPTDKVHFHEIGAIDSIVDIVGVCILIEKLNPQQILASPPCDGFGTIHCAHGHFPIPTPATLEILKGVPLRQIHVEGELITPTGAGILAEFVQDFIPLPTLQIEKIGYGIGSRSFPNHPNILRTFLGTAQTKSSFGIDVIETNIDDLSPEILAVATEKLLSEGALDVYLSPILMKKGRLGTLLSLLVKPSDTQRLAQRLFQETGTFGLRIYRADRICLQREIRKLKTRYGTLEIKVGSFEGKIISAKPEFETCKKIALKNKASLKTVWTYALAECAKILSS